MYEHLLHLEKTILTIKKQHRLVSAELNMLKQQSSGSKEFNALKTNLESTQTERDTLKKQLIAFDERYQNLAEAHHMLGEEQDKLQQQLADLQQQNKALQQQHDDIQQQNVNLQQQIAEVDKKNINLQEKNRLASERTQVVLDRLTHIDQVDG